MSIFYKFLYLVGLKPWEEMYELPISHQIRALLDREESGRTRPFGSALDLGCGSGIWSVELAKRGWRVTGVDIVPKALRAAQQRVSDAGVEVKLLEGSITALRSAEIGNGFSLALDFGVIHGLNRQQRLAVGQEVTAVTESGATLLMLAWEPGSRGPLPHGIDASDVAKAFPEWKIVSDEIADVTDAPGLIRKAKPHFYRLCRG